MKTLFRGFLILLITAAAYIFMTASQECYHLRLAFYNASDKDIHILVGDHDLANVYLEQDISTNKSVSNRLLFDRDSHYKIVIRDISGNLILEKEMGYTTPGMGYYDIISYSGEDVHLDSREGEWGLFWINTFNFLLRCI